MTRKRVLVTGSSRGIGREIALRLAADGWNVALHYSTHGPEADALARGLGEQAAGVYRRDLAEPEQAAKLFEDALSDGEISAVVNNAGIYMPLDFLGSGDAAFEANFHKTLAVNFASPVWMMRAACRHFAEHGGGKVLNVASRVGFKSEAGASIYAASKAALINMTRSLAVELAPKNIGVFGIAPGWVDTAMARAGVEQRAQEIMSTIPLGRMASPQDCAATASFLLSDDAAYLSGVVIDINGASYFH